MGASGWGGGTPLGDSLGMDDAGRLEGTSPLPADIEGEVLACNFRELSLWQLAFCSAASRAWSGCESSHIISACNRMLPTLSTLHSASPIFCRISSEKGRFQRPSYRYTRLSSGVARRKRPIRLPAPWAPSWHWWLPFSSSPASWL